MSEKEIEQEIQDKGLNAPRLTQAQIDAAIKSKVFQPSLILMCLKAYQRVSCSF